MRRAHLDSILPCPSCSARAWWPFRASGQRGSIREAVTSTVTPGGGRLRQQHRRCVGPVGSWISATRWHLNRHYIRLCHTLSLVGTPHKLPPAAQQLPCPTRDCGAVHPREKDAGVGILDDEVACLQVASFGRRSAGASSNVRPPKATFGSRSAGGSIHCLPAGRASSVGHLAHRLAACVVPSTANHATGQKSGNPAHPPHPTPLTHAPPQPPAAISAAPMRLKPLGTAQR